MCRSEQDHVRRITRFRKHVTAPEFPQAQLEFDARGIAKQLDKIVNARLSAQTQFGGEAASVLTKITSTKRARGQAEEDEEDSPADDEDEDEAAALQGKSKRAEKKAEREQKMKVKRVARKEKIARIKREKEAKSAGVVVAGASSSKMYAADIVLCLDSSLTIPSVTRNQSQLLRRSRFGRLGSY